MSTVEEQLKAADELHMKEAVHEMFALLEKLDKENPKTTDVMWRLARANYLVAKEHVDDAANREKHMRAGLALIEAAHSADGKSAPINKWHGIMLGSMGEFISTKEKIGNAYKIKEFFLKALEVNPGDATTHHALATWCWSVANVGMIERGLASALFATPPTSSYAECEQYAMKSFELDPSQVANCLLLGDCYYAQRNWAEAKRFFTLASECPAITAAAKKHAADAKAKIGKC